MLSVKRILQLLVYLSALAGSFPVLPFLPWWLQLSLLSALLLGIIGDRRDRYLLTALPATILSCAFLLFFLLQISASNLVEPLIQMLCLLLAVRLATEKTARNVLQLFLLATIVLAASSLLTLNMAYLFYLVLTILLVTSGLLLLCFYAADQRISFNRAEWRLLLKVMILLPVSSLLLMLVFFVILPRTQTPLWNFLNPKIAANIGMSDQVRPGSVTDLAQSSRTAFRVETDRLPFAALYWRGIVLNQLEGQVWKRSATMLREKLLVTADPDVLLSFFTEPKADHYLLTLDQPRIVEGIRHELAADGVVTGRLRSGRILNYQVRARPAARSQQLGPVDEYLRLPRQLSKRLQEVGERVSQGGNYRDKIDRLNEFFIGRQLNYSSRQLPTTTDPVDIFLFESRRGYCEYFASSFALLLRLAGVPSRLVGGYLGGEYNDLGGYYLVGEDLAHVWVEALDDQGLWQRIDPSRLAVNAEQALLQSRRQGLSSFQTFSDALLHYWSRLVLNYDLHQQFGLLRQLARQVRDVKTIGLESLSALLWIVPLTLLLFLLCLFRRRPPREQRLIHAYHKQILYCSGLEELPNPGLFAIARLTGEPLCREFAELYGQAYYRDLPLEPAAFRRLKRIVGELAERQDSIEVAILESVGDNDNLRN